MSAPRPTRRILTVAGAIPFALAIGAGTAGASTAPSSASLERRQRGHDDPHRHHRRGLRRARVRVPLGRSGVRGAQRRRHRGHRVRGAVGRPHPRREGEPAAGLQRLVLAASSGRAPTSCTAPAPTPSAASSPSSASSTSRLRPTSPGSSPKGADGYLGYVRNQVTRDADGRRRAGRGDPVGRRRGRAKLAYIQARPFYERIEPVAESFVLGDRNLDAAIDLRADDVAPTDLEGFHRIEYGLWTDASTDGLADVSAQLVADVASLQQLIDGLDGLQAFDLANGAVGLLDEAVGQDHRRGGALLAHRPARPGRQRRGFGAGLRLPRSRA